MTQQNEWTATDVASTPVTTYSPVILPVPGRPVGLHLKVLAPAAGTNLPVMLFSHGHGQSMYLSSLRGYGPLVDFYAAQGFVVIQPTHLDSKALKLDPTGPEGPLFWKSRAQDMHTILDHLDRIEDTVPGLRGRLDKSRMVAVGHSMGGHTVSMLAGMRVTDTDGQEVNLTEPRLKAVVNMAGPGDPADLAPFAAEHFPVMKSLNFTQMTLLALVVVGDKDKNPMFSEKDNWRAGSYYLSNGPKCLLSIVDGEHMLGGVSGYDVKETTDEDPERVALVQRLTLAYLRSALDPQDTAWQQASQQEANPKASIECKGY